jgi:adenylosuccinate synthase
MPTTVVVGTQWGDEGKGKVVDFLARDADIVVRSQGGNNAGHTVAIGEDIFKLYHLPCGVLHPEKLNIIGGGMVLHPPALLAEIDALQARGIPVNNLTISHHAHMIMPYHLLLDGLEESRRTSGDSRGIIGTSRRGIGPTYADKMSRSGLRVCELADPETFRTRVKFACEEKNALITGLYGADPVDPDAIADEYIELGKRIVPYLGDVVAILNEGLENGAHILFEGAQGTLLDIDYGISYPFLTSSHPVSAGACLATGLAPNRIDRICGVVKAYISRVGSGPFPTELMDDLGVRIRERGQEYGTVTGRPRRVGWLDLVLLKYSALLNGLTEMIFTKVDVLDELPELKVAVSYDLDGKRITHFPSDPAERDRIVPVYETVPGWVADTTALRTGDRLPEQLEDYIRFVSRYIGVPITLLGVGNRRSQMVELV